MRNDAARDAFRGPEIKLLMPCVNLVVSPAMGVSTLEPGGVGARIAPPYMEATDASRLVCVVVVSYQEFSLSLSGSTQVRTGAC